MAATRSPIGRARKWSLRDVRPDDLTTSRHRSRLRALAHVPELDPHDVEDLILRCGQPGGGGGGAGSQLRRVVALRAGLDDVPGTTATRYCAASCTAQGR
ncbi:hypothetical protein [Microbacterium sp. A84]|uniref:hypothetical protein n=1 Tax=Microbacterium sp. A84 TaxID=3450715 RepID=UPI003F43AE9D